MPWLWLLALLLASMDLKAKGGLFMCGAGAGILMDNCAGRRESVGPACPHTLMLEQHLCTLRIFSEVLHSDADLQGAVRPLAYVAVIS